MTVRMLVCVVAGDGFANTYTVQLTDDRARDESLLRQRVVREFCLLHWDEVEDKAGPMDETSDPEAVYKAYFDHHAYESVYINDSTLEYNVRPDLKTYEGLKTRLPPSITTVEEACAWLRDLFANEETWHCEDNPADCFEHLSEECTSHMGRLMAEIYNLPGNRSGRDMLFDPCAFILALMNPPGWEGE